MSPKPSNSTQLNLEYALLGLLENGPMHGYEMHHRMTDLAGVGLVWQLKQANLYAYLSRLEQQGLISARLIDADVYPPRREYALTKTGQAALGQWLQMPVIRPRDMRQGFLVRLYFARRHSEIAARELIARQREVCQQWLAQAQAQVKQLRPEQSYAMLVLQYRINQILAAMTWLDWCEHSRFMEQNQEPPMEHAS